MIKILQNEKVRLIPLVAEHKNIFITLANIPEINHRVNKPFPYLEEHFSDQLSKIANHYFAWMIEQNSQLVGVINSAAGKYPRLFQGGYWINPLFWNKGAATASVTLVKDFLMDECNAERIQAVVEPDNKASIHVLEKCGYHKEGLLRKFYPHAHRGLIDVLMYACVR